MRRRWGAGRDERGTGVIGTWIGFVVFIGMLLFTVQSLLNLYATSVLTSVAWDAAREVASSHGDAGAQATAETRARHLLGRYGEDVVFDWSRSSEEDIVLRVQGDVPSVVMQGFGGRMPFASIDRTVRLRVERFRA